MSVELFTFGCLGLKAWLDEQLATGRLPYPPQPPREIPRPLSLPTAASVATYVATEIPTAASSATLSESPTWDSFVELVKELMPITVAVFTGLLLFCLTMLLLLWLVYLLSDFISSSNSKAAKPAVVSKDLYDAALAQVTEHEETIESLIDERDEMEETLAARWQRLQEFSEGGLELLKENNGLQQTVSQQQAELVKAGSDVAEDTQTITRLEAELRASRAETLKAQKAAEDYRTGLQASQSECTKHKDDLAKASSDAAEASETVIALGKEVEDGKKRATDCETELESSQTEVSEAKEATRSVQRKLDAARQECEKHRADLEKASTDAAGTSKTIATLKEEIEYGKKQVAACEEKLAAAGRKEFKAQKTIESEREKTKDLAKRLKTADRDATNANKKINELKLELSNARELLTTATEEATQARQTAEKEQDKVKDLNAQLSGADKNATTSQKKFEALQQELNTAHSAITSARTEAYRASEEKVDGLQQELSALRGELVSVRGLASEAAQTAESRGSDLEALQEKFAKASNDFAEAEQKRDRLQTELDEALGKITDPTATDVATPRTPLPFPTFVGAHYPDGTPVKGDWRKNWKNMVKRWERASLEHMGLLPPREVYHLEPGELQGVTEVMRRIYLPGMWWEKKGGCRYDPYPPPRDPEVYWGRGEVVDCMTLEEAREKGRRDFGGSEKVKGTGMGGGNWNGEGHGQVDAEEGERA